MTKIFYSALSAIALTAAPASAQLAPDSNAPIDITADAAEFQDNLAVWTGNVRILQGEAILTAQRIEADLNDDGDFDRIRAIGNVRYSNGNEAITGETGLYESKSRTITITDNVIVTQGQQVMAAGSVTYWVDSGKVKFTPAAGQRIRGIFYTDSTDDQI